MTKGWDWVIGAGLYVAALVLTWLTLFSLERFGATEVRSWAPLIQAVLSAAAIFSAWGLQSLKRKSDRNELEGDTRVTLLEFAYIFEWTIGRAYLSLKAGNFQHTTFQLYRPILAWSVDGMADIKLSHLPSQDAVRDAVAMQHSSRLALAVIDWAIDQKVGIIPETYLDESWRSTFKNRSDLLRALGAAARDRRTDPPTPNQR